MLLIIQPFSTTLLVQLCQTFCEDFCCALITTLVLAVLILAVKDDGTNILVFTFDSRTISALYSYFLQCCEFNCSTNTILRSFWYTFLLISSNFWLSFVTCSFNKFNYFLLFCFHCSMWLSSWWICFVFLTLSGKKKKTALHLLSTYGSSLSHWYLIQKRLKNCKSNLFPIMKLEIWSFRDRWMHCQYICNVFVVYENIICQILWCGELLKLCQYIPWHYFQQLWAFQKNCNHHLACPNSGMLRNANITFYLRRSIDKFARHWRANSSFSVLTLMTIIFYRHIRVWVMRDCSPDC